jgi:hypothetical protein
MGEKRMGKEDGVLGTLPFCSAHMVTQTVDVIDYVQTCVNVLRK